MGGVSSALTAVQLGSTALNLLDNSKEKKRESEYLAQSYQASVKKRKTCWSSSWLPAGLPWGQAEPPAANRHWRFKTA